MGAGKSTCAGLMAGLTAGPETRVSVIDADQEAKRMMNGDESIKRRLAAAFDASVIHGNSVVFGRLGKAAFASVQTMRILNSIVHPPLVKRLEGLLSLEAAPCILDAALIPMWGIESWFDRCLWVTAPPSLRIARTKAKTGLPLEQISLRMKVQEALFGPPASGPQWTIVENDGSLDELRDRIAGLHVLRLDEKP
jgi:dephospho-CoA kinase